MADTLLIHYSPETPDQSVWSIVNAEGVLTTRLTRGNISEASDIAGKHRVIMLLDSNFIHFDSVQLPTKNKQKLLHAVPFALEEDLADEIEDLHFVIAKTEDSDTTAVVCINREILNNILTHCHESNITLDAIVPDALCLTADKNQWAILFFEGSTHIQHSVLSALSVERAHYKTVLNHTFDNAIRTPPNKIILFQLQDEELEQLDNEKLTGTEIINIAYNDHPLVVYCGHYKQAMGLNLLQGDYKQTRKSNAHFKRWRLAAALAFIWLTAHLGNIAYQGNKLETSNQALRTEIIQIYKDSFPESKRIVDARVQMEQELNELRSGSGGDNTGFISLLSDSHHAFSANKGVTIKSLSFRNNSIDITVTSTDLKSVEQINKQLNTDNLKSEIVSSTAENNIVKGDLRIQRPKS